MGSLPIISALREPGFSRKLTLAFVAVILVVALTIPVAFVAFHSIGTSSERAAQSSRTLEKVGMLQQAIGDMRATARDYTRTGDDADRDRLTRQLSTLTGEALCLSRPNRCANEEGGRLSTLPDEEAKGWAQIADNASRAHSDFRKAADRNQSNRAIDQFDARMAEGVAEPARDLAQKARKRGEDARTSIPESIRTSGVMLIIVLVAAMALASVLAWWIPKSLMRRLDRLRLVAHQLAGGDLSARVDVENAGTDELAELIGDFNNMARMMELRHDENTRLQEQLHLALMSEQERATRDPLTGLRNHRYFQESLASEIDRCSRSGAQVTIAVLDLDNFKQVNDRFGHHEGDAVLLRVTQGIADNLRPYDLACRLGGEEFGVIFPETSAEEAKVVMDRIAEHILNFGPNGERATFSAGLATYPLHSTRQTELYQHADEAAYTAKSAGKAQSVIYDPRKVVAMDSEERMKQRSREAVLNTATTLVSAVDQKDPYTRHHSELTAIYAATIARALRLDEETVKLVYRAALLHDVGKIGVADHILKKPGRLTDEEFAQVKMHPEFSYRILENAEMEPIATWTRHHHEHWDGSGYPFGLSGTAIPLGSRIILVADAFEAMTSDRIYRRSLGTAQALQELTANAGRQFDPQIADVMVRLVTSGVFDPIRRQYGRHVEGVIVDPNAPAVDPNAAPAPAAHDQAPPPAALPPGQHPGQHAA